MNKIYTHALLGASLILTLNGCATMQQRSALPITDPAMSQQLDQLFSGITPKNEIEKRITTGIVQIRKGNYAEASNIFQEGLRLNNSNGQLHFLNALAYHMNGLSGNSKMLELAQSGYLTALKFDSTNYLAAYLLGHIYFDRRDFVAAQNTFSYGLLYAPANPYLLRALAVSSYYCNDAGVNEWAAQKAFDADSTNLANLRTLMFSKASTGKSEEAAELLNKYNAVLHERSGSNNGFIRQIRYDVVSDRINDWKNYYASADPAIFSNSVSSQDILGSGNSGNTIDASPYQVTSRQNDPTGPSQKESNTTLPRMTLVDVTIIRTEESKSQAKGINLLAGLQTTLSGSLSYYKTIGKDADGKNSNSETITFAPSLNLLNLEYNLNIFNDGSNKAEVLARPSLLAIENETSKFFSGAILHVQLSSNNSDGSLVDIPIGINLSVTPQFYGDDTVKVTVHADRSFLDEGSGRVGFSAFSQTSSTSVDATAVLKFGETLILSGLSENQNDASKDGVPFLQDVPGIQYLFSRKEELETKKSILILLTPQKARYSNRNATAEELQKELKESKEGQTTYTSSLKNKEKIKASNMDAAIAHLSRENQFYRQFRTGDLELDSWNNDDTMLGAFKRALGFLYY